MTKIKIDPRKKLFYWGPADGQPVFPDYWNLGLHYFTADYPPGWPNNFIYFENERITFVSEYKKLYDNGETVFKKYVLDKKRLKGAYNNWQNLLNNFGEIKKRVEKTDLANLTKDELKALFLKFQHIYNIEFWRHSMLPEIANWGGEQLLIRELKKRIKNENDFVYALERLTAPEDYSFYQKEELELLQIKFLKKRREKREKMVAHQKKYFWMHNSYHHTQILPVSYFEKILSGFTEESARKKIKEIKKIKVDAAKHKLEVVKKFHLPKRILEISHGLSFCIWWQDIRKAYIFQANHLIDLFIREFSRRSKIPPDEFYYYTAADLTSFMKGHWLQHRGTEERKKGFLIYLEPSEKKTILFSGEKAKNIFRIYAKKKPATSKKELRGMVVNRGRVTGRVKIIFSPTEISKMKKGNILVTTMTTPDFISALRKAAAIVTDEGGMTCHAAIVSRELGIPGIVATKIATRILKDGDLVEIDANRGLIRKIGKT